MKNLKLRSILLQAIAFSLLLVALPTNAETNPLKSSIEFANSIVETVASVSDNNGQWFTYQVAMEPNNGMPCCLTNDTESSCSLDDRTDSWSSSITKLEGSKALNIYFKMDSGKTSDLFLAGSECKVETDNNLVYTISGVTQKQSVLFLSKLLENNVKNTQLTHKSLAAIALHQGRDAHAVLDKLADSENRKLKHQAIFWLGEARNEAGYESLLTIVDDSDRDYKARKQAVFALSINSYEKSSEKLVQLAKHSDNEKIQAESVFWLAQNHKSKAIAVIDYILEHGDNTHVRKKAVFSLAQISTKESWQQLIDLAQSSTDRDVQEEAIFWLSQNEDENPVAILMALAKGQNPESVKKKAVFALAQLQSSQSTPALSELIETATEKSVKKEALFWLGQSNDSNAMDYLERLLTANL